VKKKLLLLAASVLFIVYLVGLFLFDWHCWIRIGSDCGLLIRRTEISFLYNPLKELNAPDIDDYLRFNIPYVVYFRRARTVAFWSLDVSCPNTTLGALAAGTAALCAWRIRAQAKRRRSGYCTKCGYDLRASIQRCPECGQPFKDDAPT
jgi:hypothetical protein